jgi:hypothetical protein
LRSVDDISVRIEKSDARYLGHKWYIDSLSNKKEKCSEDPGIPPCIGGERDGGLHYLCNTAKISRRGKKRG